MRIALFGGTFNPIHFGHLLLAESAREQFRLDRILFLPTGLPPHKPAPLTDVRHRLAMTRLALHGNAAFQVSDWEIRQKRPVYTYETLEYFARRRPRARLFFLMGSDSLSQIRHWRHGLRLLDRATFLIGERPEQPWSALPAALRRPTRLVESPPVALASHEIRRRVRQGGSIRYQVPEAVDRYIRQHRLYRRNDPS